MKLIDMPCPLDSSARLILLDVLDALEKVQTAAGLKECMSTSAQAIFPHGGFACGMRRIDGSAIQPGIEPILHQYPKEYIEAVLRQPDGRLSSPAMQRWRATRAPVLIDLDRPEEWSPDYIAMIRKYELGNIASHGFLDVQGWTMTYLRLIRVPESLDDKHVYLLNRLMPHLHLSLLRIYAGMIGTAAKAASKSEVKLTARQKQILQWLYVGKTNWEVSQILSTSEDNVKYHISQILTRLNATNRTQAVAKAFALNLIQDNGPVGSVAPHPPVRATACRVSSPHL